MKPAFAEPVRAVEASERDLCLADPFVADAELRPGWDGGSEYYD